MRGLSYTHALLLMIQTIVTNAIGTDDQVESDIDYGTFQNPSSNVRARFRYWLNDASHNLSHVAEDMKAVGRAGAGGVELLGYYLYGDTGNFNGSLDAVLESDWTVYGFGGTPWRNLADTVLSTAKEEKLLVDLAIGPNQGAGVPAPYNDDGLLWDLAGFNSTVPKGTAYSSTLPGWGGAHNSDTLVAASAGLIVDQNLTQVTLSTSSLIDLTSQVSPSGQLSYNFSNTQEGSAHVLFAFYLVHPETREVNASTESVAAVAQSPIENWTQNGSWVVDHFSAAGALLVVDFWNQSLLSGNIAEDIREVGNYLWEDSQEYNSHSKVLWTPRLPQVFEEKRGYSFGKYIPLVFGQKSGGGQVAGFSSAYVLDEADGGNSYIQDFQQTLTELNAEYLQALTAWSAVLGAQSSAQIVYNLPMDMLANIPLVNAPECETLGFSHNIDGYRQFAGPANLAGKRVISNECGANMGQAYQLPIPELLWDIKRAVAGGVNQFVLHGYPVSGDYGGTTWPGFTSFAYLFSEMHGPRQPGWEFYEEWLDWTARTQFVTQTGVPKVDLAFWLKSTDAYLTIATQYAPLDLQTAGYTYEYLSPDNFDLPEAYVRDGVFAPNRQAFKALIVRANDSLTASGVQKLAQYADQGLPILFSGGIPSETFGHDQVGNENLTATMEGLTRLNNVHVVPYDDLASSLASFNISPRSAIVSNGSWYTYWRDDAANSTPLVYVYNDATNVSLGGGMTVGKISFETTGKPFVYDAWTGKVTALSAYQQSETHTTVQLQLAGNQSIILGFDSDAHNQSAIKSELQVESVASKSSMLSGWTLTVESWGPPANIYDIDAGPTKTNSTPYTLDSLIPWSQISDSLRNVSGRGYYHATFSWPTETNSTASGAVLDLGAIIHTARLSVNGQVVPPLDPTWARADIGAYLKEGDNEVDVVVSTPLGNGLRSVWSELETSGKLATVTLPQPPSVADYGLVQEVKLMPY